MKIVNVKAVEAKLLEKIDAVKVRVKYLLTDREGAKKFHMRVFVIEPGGHTSYDQHIYEHEVYILRGKGKIVTIKNGGKKEVEIGVGDAILIESNEVHQIFNIGDEPLEFICIKGVEEAY